jgi:hypothetical protein
MSVVYSLYLLCFDVVHILFIYFMQPFSKCGTFHFITLYYSPVLHHFLSLVSVFWNWYNRCFINIRVPFFFQFDMRYAYLVLKDICCNIPFNISTITKLYDRVWCLFFELNFYMFFVQRCTDDIFPAKFKLIQNVSSTGDVTYKYERDHRKGSPSE